MTTIDQVLSADKALSSALEEFTSVCIASKPSGFKGMSFAMEEAVTDVKENARQSLWERFKAFVRRIIDWFATRFKKLGEKKKTEAEKFEEELEESNARWKASLDETMENLRKSNEEFMKRAKPAHADMQRKTQQFMDPDQMDELYKRAFATIKDSVAKDATDIYNEHLKKFTGIGTMLNEASFSGNSLASITKLPQISEAYAELKRITVAVKGLASMLRTENTNAAKLHDYMSGLEGNALDELAEKFKGREGKHITVTDLPTVRSVDSVVRSIKVQFDNLGEWTTATEFNEALDSIRQSIESNRMLDSRDENFSAVLKDMQQALSVLISNVGSDVFSLQMLVSVLRGELIGVISIPLALTEPLTMKHKAAFTSLVKKENNYVLNFTAEMHLRFQIQNMLAGVK